MRLFLNGCGYKKTDLASVLVGIKRAYVAFSSKGADFPHELGVILEYPVPAVRQGQRHGCPADYRRLLPLGSGRKIRR